MSTYKHIGGTNTLVVQIHWWYKYIGGTNTLVVQTHWWYKYIGGINTLVVQTHWWYKYIGVTTYDFIQSTKLSITYNSQGQGIVTGQEGTGILGPIDSNVISMQNFVHLQICQCF